MPRIRTVKPELFKHEDLVELENETGLPIRVAFIGLFTACDREGRFKWRPRTLKLDILPHDELDFSRVLHALGTRGFIVRYTSAGETYGCIPTFTKHQVINHREMKSDLPGPKDKGSEIQSFADASITREPRDDDASTTREARERHAARGEGKGKEGKGKEPPLPPKGGEGDGFDQFWSAYPRKTSKPQAVTAWRKLRLDSEVLPAVLVGLNRDVRSEQWIRDGGRFIPYPATWLNGRRWEDELPLKLNGDHGPGVTKVDDDVPRIPRDPYAEA